MLVFDGVGLAGFKSRANFGKLAETIGKMSRYIIIIMRYEMFLFIYM